MNHGKLTVNESGMTLIELMIAMLVASIMLTTVFFMWNYINMHIGKSKYHTQLETETSRIGSLIASQIRKSQSILEWSDNRILMLNGNGSDTLDYYYSENELLLNGTKLSILVNNARVTVFELKDLNDHLDGLNGSLMLELTLSIVGRETDSVTVRHIVQVSQSVNKSSGSGTFMGF